VNIFRCHFRIHICNFFFKKKKSIEILVNTSKEITPKQLDEISRNLIFENRKIEIISKKIERNFGENNFGKIS